MFLIAGLGNPGLKYHNTKHNFGFILADAIINSYNLQPQGIKFNSQIFSGNVVIQAGEQNFNEKVILVKPQDYINCSGVAVLLACQFYKITSEQVIVLHDDLDLELGKVKAKIGGGNGGHNGLKDIDAKIGQNYYRIRLGIGRPENPEYQIADYVLSKFNQEELKKVADINQKICQNFNLVLQKNLVSFLNKIAI